MSDTIYEVMSELETVIDDVQRVVEECLTWYQEIGLPELPEDFHVFKNNQFYYKMYKQCVNDHDRVVDVSTRLVVVSSKIKDIRSTHIDRGMWNDFRDVKKFRDYLDGKIGILDSYKFALNDVKRSVSDRIKLLQGIQFNF